MTKSTSTKADCERACVGPRPPPRPDDEKPAYLAVRLGCPKVCGLPHIGAVTDQAMDGRFPELTMITQSTSTEAVYTRACIGPQPPPRPDDDDDDEKPAPLSGSGLSEFVAYPPVGAVTNQAGDSFPSLRRPYQHCQYNYLWSPSGQVYHDGSQWRWE
jgi:hypothetical protein